MNSGEFVQKKFIINLEDRQNICQKLTTSTINHIFNGVDA